MSTPDLIYTGSVKNIRKGQNEEELLFDYSDRYSVFDWGAMPDELPQKGEALALLGHHFFRLLQSRVSIVHHALEINKRTLRVQKVDVARPPFSQGVYDYSAYEKRPVKALVPLEVIFRYGAPKGSSLLERAKDKKYLKDLGLSCAPQEGERFLRPVIEFSTKLESTDRPLFKKEAQKIAGLNDLEMEKLCLETEIVARELKAIFFEIGVELWDGKIEWAFTTGQNQDFRSFMLVDSIGPDELRLTFEGMSLSKENLRQIYRKSSWYKAVVKAKELAKTRNSKDWKKICQEELKEAPKALSLSEKEGLSMIYLSLAQTISQHFFNESPFPHAWELPRLRAFLETLKQ